MFICRHHLLKAHVPNCFPSSLLNRSPLPIEYSRFVLSGHYVRTRSITSKGGEEGGQDRYASDGVGGPHTGSIIRPNTSPASTPLPIKKARSTESRVAQDTVDQLPAKLASFGWNQNPVAAYMKLRKQDERLIRTIPPRLINLFLNAATLHPDPKAVKKLVGDFQKHPSKSLARDKAVLMEILLHSSHPAQVINKRTLLKLLLDFKQRCGNLDFPPRAIACLGRAFISYPPAPAADLKLDPPFLEILVPLLLSSLANSSDQPELSRTSQHAPHKVYSETSERFIWPLFFCVMKYSELGLQEQALDLFQALVSDNVIPSEAMQGIDITSKDFSYIVNGSMVQTCIQRGWLKQATSLLIHIQLSHGGILQPWISRYLIDILRARLQRKSIERDDLVASASIIVQLFKAPDPVIISNELLNVFYHFARTEQAGDLVEVVYEITRSVPVLEKHNYPPPSGPSALWFLEHCVNTTKSIRMARMLAQHIVQDDTVIPFYDRPVVIATIAGVGLATQARALWRKSGSRPGSEIVRGSSSTMLRLVSLFASLIRRGEAIQATADAVRQMSDEAMPADYEAEKSGEDEDETKQEGMADGQNADENVEDWVSPYQAASLVRPELKEAKEYQSDEARQARIEDLRTFAEQVIKDFRDQRKPLAKANHFDLNALARAYFIMGKIHAGFNMFKIMLARHEIPDLQDVNVALSAMAELNPKKAADMLEMMAKRGLQPDAVSFGTVIHHAILHSEEELVTSLVSRARDFGITRLSFKTLGTMIRATISPENNDSDTEGALEKTKELVDMLLEADYLPTARMGIDCVIAALRAHDPVTAYNFWKQLVLGKLDWDGEQHSFTRGQIAKQIRKATVYSSLNRDQARTMLSTLGESVSLSVRHPNSNNPVTEQQIVHGLPFLRRPTVGLTSSQKTSGALGDDDVDPAPSLSHSEEAEH